jgi:hypothetical protein
MKYFLKSQVLPGHYFSNFVFKSPYYLIAKTTVIIQFSKQQISNPLGFNDPAPFLPIALSQIILAGLF